jgi:hypothetical protein
MRVALIVLGRGYCIRSRSDLLRVNLFTPRRRYLFGTSDSIRATDNRCGGNRDGLFSANVCESQTLRFFECSTRPIWSVYRQGVYTRVLRLATELLLQILLLQRTRAMRSLYPERAMKILICSPKRREQLQASRARHARRTRMAKASAALRMKIVSTSSWLKPFARKAGMNWVNAVP